MHHYTAKDLINKIYIKSENQLYFTNFRKKKEKEKIFFKFC